MTYKILANRAAQLDSQQPTQMTRQQGIPFHPIYGTMGLKEAPKEKSTLPGVPTPRMGPGQFK